MKAAHASIHSSQQERRVSPGIMTKLTSQVGSATAGDVETVPIPLLVADVEVGNEEGWGAATGAVIVGCAAWVDVARPKVKGAGAEV